MIPIDTFYLFFAAGLSGFIGLLSGLLHDSLTKSNPFHPPTFFSRLGWMMFFAVIVLVGCGVLIEAWNFKHPAPTRYSYSFQPRPTFKWDQWHEFDRARDDDVMRRLLDEMNVKPKRPVRKFWQTTELASHP